MPSTFPPSSVHCRGTIGNILSFVVHACRRGHRANPFRPATLSPCGDSLGRPLKALNCILGNCENVWARHTRRNRNGRPARWNGGGSPPLMDVSDCRSRTDQSIAVYLRAVLRWVTGRSLPHSRECGSVSGLVLRDVKLRIPYFASHA